MFDRYRTGDFVKLNPKLFQEPYPIIQALKHDHWGEEDSHCIFSLVIYENESDSSFDFIRLECVANCGTHLDQDLYREELEDIYIALQDEPLLFCDPMEEYIDRHQGVDVNAEATDLVELAFYLSS